jgi:hypothetical protein
MDYIGKDIIDNADKVSAKILSEKRNNHHRDHFFPLLIERLGLKQGVEIGFPGF